jgi:hypothetical protein
MPEKLMFARSARSFSHMGGLSYWNDWQNGLYCLTERGGSQHL